MKRYVMTRDTDTGAAVVTVFEDDLEPRPLKHLAHKSKVIDWTRSSGPGAGNAPSDLARSIVGDLLGFETPSPALYREVTARLARIPADGGELTVDEVLSLIDEGLIL